MSGILDVIASVATMLSVALIVWGGVLAVGCALGSSLRDTGQSPFRRIAVGGLAVALGVFLVTPGHAERVDDQSRALDAPDAST